jgi:hypothetical protein
VVGDATVFQPAGNNEQPVKMALSPVRVSTGQRSVRLTFRDEEKPGARMLNHTGAVALRHSVAASARKIRSVIARQDGVEG